MKKLKYTIISVVLLIGTIWSIGPLLWTLSTSFKNIEEVRQAVLTYIPQNFTIEAYKNIFTSYPFGNYLTNSLVVAVVSTLIIVVVGTFCGYTFSRYRFKGDIIIFYVILAVRIFPPISIIVPFYRVLGSLNLLDTKTGLVLASIYMNLPLIIWLMRGFFISIPQDLDEAARVDGATRFQVFFKIVMPLTLPGIAAASIMAFLYSWNNYLFPLVLTFTDNAMTLPLATSKFTTDVSILWNNLAASAIVTCIPAIIFVLFFQKWLISGLTKGAIKG